MLIVDMLNTLDFPEGDQLLKTALPAAHAIKRLKDEARREKIPVIYVNDNFGHWHSNSRQVYELCLNSRGRELAQLLEPDKEDYFVLKPQYSGFFSTPLDVLLQDLDVEHLILTGIAADICVLFTAQDAYVRGYKLTVPPDCVASDAPEKKAAALAQMQHLFKVSSPTGNPAGHKLAL